MVTNFILQADSYKPSHERLYPDDLRGLYAYFESRGGQFQDIVFFGLQYYLQQLSGQVFDLTDIGDAEWFWSKHFGRSDVFNADAWLRLHNKHAGRLPLRIKALPEGTVVPTHIPLFTVENTDDEFPWLVTYVETLLSKVWYPTTIATQSHYLRERIRSIGLDTSDNIDASVDFMVHDFGYRGVTCEEQAQIGGAAHLLSFKGTDTIAGIRFLQQYYTDYDKTPLAPMYGFSIPATEHSVIMTHPSEEAAFKHVLEVFPDGIVACVSDTVDIRQAVEKLWGERFHDQIETRNGRLVVRPDSGDPREIVLWTLEMLWERFGGTLTRYGYRVLAECIRVIQGDGMNVTTIPELYQAVVDANFAVENVAVGSGGGLLQQVTRDTCRFAYKPSWARYADETTRNISKNPKTDGGKRSQAGRFAVIHRTDDLRTKYECVQETSCIGSQNLLTTVFENGIMSKTTTYEEIVARMRGLKR